MDFTDEFADVFDNNGRLREPTLRGNANLDIQDYAGWDGFSEILADELQEDIPSRPGRGAAPATDVEGMRGYRFLEVEGGMEAPGMKQTTYGASPWGPGSGAGYRPHSQQRTDMDLRATAGLGAVDLSTDPSFDPARDKTEAIVDDMWNEPEVIDTEVIQEAAAWDKSWHGSRNNAPSNSDIDPMTLNDRESFEYDNSSQNVIGTGIFDDETGTTWRPRDGSFSNQYAMPAYLAEEDELGVQQSEMWDSTADNWRVTQVSASGVPLSRTVPTLKANPFRTTAGRQSRIEAFGRDVAKALVRESQAYRPEHRSFFLTRALEALEPGVAPRVHRAAQSLIRMGYQPEKALEDAAAHAIMHAAVRDLTQANRPSPSRLPRLDRMGTQVRREAGAVRSSAAVHLQPLVTNVDALRADLGTLYASPTAHAMGYVMGETPESAAQAAPTSAGWLRPRNLLIGAGIGAGLVLLARQGAVRKNVANWFK